MAIPFVRTPSAWSFVRKKDQGLPPVNGWSPSTVRTILAREIYNGVFVWNKSRKRNKWGKVQQVARPQSEWKRVPSEHWRIVSADLWARVAARRVEVEGKAARFSSGRITGRPPKDTPKNLLAGLATCGICGGGMVVETSPRKRGRVAEYWCHRYRNLRTCTNSSHIPAADMNEDVLQAIEEHALTPEAVEQVVQATERDDHRDRQRAIEHEGKDVAKRIKRLVNMIETGDETPSLVARLRELEARQTALRAEGAGLHPVPRLPLRAVQDRLGEWRRLLRQSVPQARAVLQKVLRGRITFTPTEHGYTFSAPTRFDKLFSGVTCPRPAWMPTEVDSSEGITPEDTFDADYGRLLERATQRICGKGVASPTGFEPVF